MATSYYAEHVHIAYTETRIPSPHYCKGQESEFEYVPKYLKPESVSVSESVGVNEPLQERLRGDSRDFMTISQMWPLKRSFTTIHTTF